MDQNSDDVIVASLMLLLDGHTLYDAQRLIVRAMVPRAKQTKFVCESCGGENLSFRADCEWHEHMQDWYVSDFDHCWCSDCDSEAHDQRVPIDWVKPEETNADS